VRPIELQITHDESIPLEKWLTFVASDPEMRLSEDFDAGDEQATAHWTPHMVSYENPWFTWFQGQIDVEVCDGKTLGKAL